MMPQTWVIGRVAAAVSTLDTLCVQQKETAGVPGILRRPGAKGESPPVPVGCIPVMMMIYDTLLLCCSCCRA